MAGLTNKTPQRVQQNISLYNTLKLSGYRWNHSYETLMSGQMRQSCSGWLSAPLLRRRQQLANQSSNGWLTASVLRRRQQLANQSSNGWLTARLLTRRQQLAKQSSNGWLTAPLLRKRQQLAKKSCNGQLTASSLQLPQSRIAPVLASRGASVSHTS